MKTLRRQMFRAVRDLRLLAVPTLVTALTLAGSAAAAGTRSHLHHPAVAPIPVSSFMETNSPRTAKKHKGHAQAEGARVNARPSSASGSGRKGKSGPRGTEHHGRVRPSDNDADPIPMYRINHPASRRGVPEGRASVGPVSGRGRHASLPQHTPQHPVLVDGRGRPVSRARFAAMRAAAPPLRLNGGATNDPGTPRSENYAAPKSYAVRSRRTLPTTASEDAASSPATFADAHEHSFATGISRPSGDDPLPRVAAAGAGTALPGASIGAALVMTPGSLRTPSSAPSTATSVVQGFGAEVALAPSDPGRAPDVTRRRDHPIPASALPGLVPVANATPRSLEERDAITLAAVSPAVLPEIYDRNGRLLMPAPLKGSHGVLLHQNTMAANDGLERIADDYELDRLRAEHALVSFPVSSSLHVSDDLPYNRRYARPWTVLFASDIGHDFYERFHLPLQVNSAVRTVSYQARLQRINGNAAATDGDAASPHLTGQAIDLGKRGMNAAELAWMRAYLMPLIASGKIDVEEEFQQACFHISVYRHYAAGRLPAHEFAQVRTPGTQASGVLAGPNP